MQADTLNAALTMGRAVAAQLEVRAELRQIVNSLVEQVRLGEEQIEIQLSRPALLVLLTIDNPHTLEASPHIILATAAAKVRRGKDIKLVVADDDGRADGCGTMCSWACC